MDRISIALVMLLALVVAACSSEGSGASVEPTEAPTPTAEPTPEATPEPSEAIETPAESASDGSSGNSELADLLPDELNGVARSEVPGLDEMIAPALAAQGIDASAVDFVFASYGEGTDGLIVQAIRVPGMSEAQLEMLAQMMAGQSTDVEIEQTEISGKTVLEMTGADLPGAAYLYFADGAMFTVIGESSELAAELLSELP